jgi:hypothetical protein
MLQSELLLDFLQARGADALIVEIDKIFNVRAENAGRRVLLQHNTVLVCVDFKRIPDLNTHRLADLGRNNDAAKLVNMSDYTGCFHRKKSSLVIYFAPLL